MEIIFFGSFQSYSVQVLEKLAANFTVTAVVTTPLAPAGRHLHLQKTAVQEFAEKNNLPVFPLATLKEIPQELARPDFLVVAGYGKLIPNNWLAFPKIMPVNVHFSLLPNYRGAFPAEWAILRGETETGVTLIKMSERFDEGEILAQTKIPITPADTRETIYHKLYDLGGMLAVEWLPKIVAGQVKPMPQPAGDYFYAKKITRQDGFIPWETFVKGINNEPIERMHRALFGWPGVWTTMTNGKRLKLIALSPEIIVQPEGKKPIPWRQFQLVHSA